MTSRRALCVSPRYAPSFGAFQYAYELTDGVKAFMPPQGLLVIAAALPKHWQVRFVDENMARATEADFAWADVVLVSGMHVQRREIQGVCRRAHLAGKAAVLGGPSVSACPELYPEFDYLHVGELGDATDELFARLEQDCARPERQVVLTTRERRPLTEFPAAGLRAGPDQPLLSGQHPVLQRLPLPVRVLRHPGALRPRPAPEDARADHGRARQAARRRRERQRLFRRRQLHRQPQGGQGSASAPDRVAAHERLRASPSRARPRSTSPARPTSWP